MKNESTLVSRHGYRAYVLAKIATMIAEVLGYKGEFVYDASKPDGTPRKLLDSSRLLGLGWRSRTPLREGLMLAYADYLESR